MSGQKHRKPVFGTKLHNNAPKKEARLRVQSGRGLVKNKKLGFVQKRTRNVNSPPLPAGELADGSVQKITEIEKFRKLRKSFFERFSVDAVQCGSTAEFPERSMPDPARNFEKQRRVFGKRAQNPAPHPCPKS